jgi:ferric-dicitrate binding protein FerR (iron transport regulator)
MENGGTHNIDLKQLIGKYFNNTCSKEELEQILELAQQGSDELLEVLKEQWSGVAEGSASSDANWGGLFHTMMNKAKLAESVFPVSAEKENPASKVLPISRTTRVPIRTIVAVAAILLVVVTTIFFLFQGNQQQPVQFAQKDTVVDVAPGGDKAILTLADGTKIALDTASNGSLAHQGGIKVIKLGGLLSYDAEGGSTEVLYNTITTPRGGQYQLELADGSKVWLNAASSLRYPTAFVGKERTVELTGEGYFEIAHHAAKPFRVKVKEMEVTVLGTHFNINSYEDEPQAKTTLLEGRVQVKKTDKYIYLNPGQQAAISEGSPSIRVINDVDVEEVVAWKNGLIQFSGADLGKVMRNISRWYNVETGYTNEQAAHLSGKVSRNLNLSQVIKVLEESGIEIRTEGKKIIATPKP